MEQFDNRTIYRRKNDGNAASPHPSPSPQPKPILKWFKPYNLPHFFDGL